MSVQSCSFSFIVYLFRKENNFQCCPLSAIKPSPVTSAYRNKCEFTVGRHLVTKEKTVGFRLSSYKAGSMSVAEPDDCINISTVMLKAVKVSIFILLLFTLFVKRCIFLYRFIYLFCF